MGSQIISKKKEKSLKEEATTKGQHDTDFSFQVKVIIYYNLLSKTVHETFNFKMSQH